MKGVANRPLAERRCVSCARGAAPLPEAEIRALLADVAEWTVVEGARIRRKIRCRGFTEAVDLVGRIAPIAEAEGHHPDLHITGYRTLTIDLTTHSAGGLTENDFILAAKIDRLLAETPAAPERRPATG